MTRREFTRLMAGAAGGALLAPVLRPGWRAAAQSAPRAKSRVALVKTDDRALGVMRALELLGESTVRTDRVLLKPNLNSADPAPGSTHPEVLRALVEHLWDKGARRITVADRSGMGNTAAVLERTGVRAQAGNLGFTAVALDELPAGAWVHRSHADYHWRDGFAVPRILLEADSVVQTCNLKTHRYGGHFTLSLKNSVGLVAKTVPGESRNYMRELHASGSQRLMIAEINHVYQPALIVVDAVEAFVAGGPARGRIARLGVMLAGTDRVAVDAVGVAMLRLEGTTPQVASGAVFAQEQIARAVELGLGARGPQDVQIVTDGSEAAAYARRVQQQLVAA